MSDVLLKIGTLIVGDGKVLNDVSVLIKDQTISGVGTDLATEAGTEVHDFFGQGSYARYHRPTCSRGI